VWWFIPVISALGRLRQEGHEFEASFGYTVRLCLKRNKQTNKTPQMNRQNIFMARIPLPFPHSWAVTTTGLLPISVSFQNITQTADTIYNLLGFAFLTERNPREIHGGHNVLKSSFPFIPKWCSGIRRGALVCLTTLLGKDSWVLCSGGLS
jgi:hypothetical protein